MKKSFDKEDDNLVGHLLMKGNKKKLKMSNEEPNVTTREGYQRVIPERVFSAPIPDMLPRHEMVVSS